MPLNDFDRFNLAFAQLRTKATPDLDPETRYSVAQALGFLMSEISERFWAVGWSTGCEDSIPNSARYMAGLRSQPKFQIPMTEEQAEALIAMSNLLGTWVTYDGDSRVRNHFLPYRPAQTQALKSEGGKKYA